MLLFIGIVVGYLQFTKLVGMYRCKEDIIYSIRASSSITDPMLNSGPKGTFLAFTETSI